jgi:acetoin:2,6-dichlorophenolindophenol oxidoreductase subunit beta
VNAENYSKILRMPTVLESLNQGLRRSLAADENVLLLGEDLLDPYGGAFKVTRGLSQEFPGRVLTTPISEAAITGVAAGMALRGLRPVVEIMFGDFLTLAADQLINHASKFRWMYNDQVRVPMVVRTPMGGRRGYGPTHSQSLEKHFLGVPGLPVFAPSSINDPGKLLETLTLTTQDPVLFVENKLQYLLKTGDGLDEFDVATYPEFAPRTLADAGLAAPVSLILRGAPPASITLAAYGYMSELARQAVLNLAYEYEIFCELVVVEQLAPLDTHAVAASLQKTQRLLVIEEGTRSIGWGAEVIAQIAEALPGKLKAVRRLAAAETPIPASTVLEEACLPGVTAIQNCVRELTA